MVAKKAAKKANDTPPAKRGLAPKNVVMTMSLGNKFDDLRRLALLVDGIYRPESFPAVNCYCKSPKCTLSVFITGQVVVTGSDSEWSAMIACHYYLATFQKLFPEKNFHMRDLSVQNVVASMATGYFIDLEKYRTENATNTDYAPDLFPGMQIRLAKKITAGVFSTGEIVLTGGKCLKDLKEAADTFDLSSCAVEKQPSTKKPVGKKVKIEDALSALRL